MAAKLNSGDHMLIEAFLKHRGEAAFRQLYRRHTPRMLRLGSRLAARSQINPEDVVQEAWVRAIRKLDGFEGRSTLSSWLGGIVVNVVREQRRMPESVPPAELEMPTIWPDPVSTLALSEGLRALPPGYRSVVTLHDIAGFTHAEIGEILKIDAGTSKSQLARARHRLRAALAPVLEKD